MQPSEEKIFITVWSYEGNEHSGMTAKQIIEQSGISPASFYRYIPSVPGMKQCAVRSGAKQYYIDPKEVVSTKDVPVAVVNQEVPTHICDSLEWTAAIPRTREALVSALSRETNEERVVKLMIVLSDPNDTADKKAVAAQILALYYLEMK